MGWNVKKERICGCSLTVCWDNSIPGPACCRKLNSSRWSMSVECVCLMACLSVLRLHEALTALSAKTHFLSLHSRLPPPPLQLTHSFEPKSKSEREGAIKKRQKGRDCRAFVYSHSIPKSLGNAFMKFGLSSQSTVKFVCVVLTEWKCASGLWVTYEGWWEIRTCSWEIQCLKACWWKVLSTSESSSKEKETT